jgi:hypothetical protein
MSKSRREFLITSSVALLGAASASQSHAQNPTDMPPGAPPAFGTAPAVGLAVHGKIKNAFEEKNRKIYETLLKPSARTSIL